MSYSGSAVQSSRSKWSNRFPVYQIDFTAVASGKRVATSKRRVRWRFGFSNKEALEAGETGTACRGEEHDVTVVWSVTSGKRLVLADGQEVHYSTVRSSVFEFSWTMRGNHVLKVVAHAAPQINPTPGFRQYDLNVDGQSFFLMPKVYELGIRGPIASHAPVPGYSSQIDRNPPQQKYGYYDLNKGEYMKPRDKLQEETDLQKAIQDSIEESRKHLQKQESYGASAAGVAGQSSQPVKPGEKAPEVDLLNMMGSMAVSNPPTSERSNDFTPQFAQQGSYAQPTQNQLAPQTYTQAPSPATYAAAPALLNAPAQTSSYNPAHAAAPVQVPATYNQQGQSYVAGNQQFASSNHYQANSAPDANTTQSAGATAAPNDANPFPAPAPPATDEQASTPYYQPQTSQTNMSVPSALPASTDPMMNKLVNFDNISAPAQAKNETQLTNIFSDAKGSDNGVSTKGPQPSLSEMQSSKPNTSKQGVMNTNHNALVATGNQPGYGVQLPQAYTQNQTQGYVQNHGYQQQQQPYDYQQQMNQQQQQQQYYNQYSQQQQQYGGYQQPPSH